MLVVTFTYTVGLRTPPFSHGTRSILLQEFSQAEHQFDRILSIDPQRIEDIDILSNILYVTDNRLRLTKLVHDFVPLGQDRPEISCLLG